MFSFSYKYLGLEYEAIVSYSNLVIAGAQRSATTALKAGLSEHPDISFLGNSEDELSSDGQDLNMAVRAKQNTNPVKK